MSVNKPLNSAQRRSQSRYHDHLMEEVRKAIAARDGARAALELLDTAVTDYMLGDIDGAAVSRAQTDAWLLLRAATDPDPRKASE